MPITQKRLIDRNGFRLACQGIDTIKSFTSGRRCSWLCGLGVSNDPIGDNDERAIAQVIPTVNIIPCTVRPPVRIIANQFTIGVNALYNDHMTVAPDRRA
ncbi:MAG: hypothetical protein WCS37_10915 [Chloroflexota bacterium]